MTPLQWILISMITAGALEIIIFWIYEKKSLARIKQAENDLWEMKVVSDSLFSSVRQDDIDIGDAPFNDITLMSKN